MKIFLRNTFKVIKHNPLYSFINFIGLIFGFVCILIIAYWVKNELSYDNFHEKGDHIYRVYRYFYNQDGTENLHLEYVAPTIGTLLRNEFSEIDKVTRVYHSDLLLSYGNQKSIEDDGCFAEPEITDIFTFDGLKKTKDILTEPLTAIISNEIAEKYFQNKPAVGSFLNLHDEEGNSYPLKIEGVYQHWHKNNHFSPEVIISFSTYAHVVGERELSDWASNNYETFALIPNLQENINAKLDDLIDKHLTYGTRGTKIRLEKLTDIHFNWYGDRAHIYILVSIALLILLLASVNYINLNTAINTKRIKEIQVKKIVGASRHMLAAKLIGESVLFTIIASVVALSIALAVIPHFDLISNDSGLIQFKYLVRWIPVYLIVSIILGIISGIFPSITLLKLRPAKVSYLNQVKSGKFYLRNTLIVFQFCISIALIFSFLSINRQLHFLHHKNLGLNKENIITFYAHPYLIERLDVFRNQLCENPNIVSVSASKRIPSQRLADCNGSKVFKNGKKESIGFRLANIRVDQEFLKTYQIDLVAGRNISDNAPRGTEYLLNETAVKKIGWQSPQMAIGEYIEYGGEAGKVTGVLKDFHYESLHYPVVPVILFTRPGSYDCISIKVLPSDLANTIKYIEKHWQEYNITGTSFSYSFVDKRYERLYRTESNTKKIFTYFMILALSIAVLGLLAISIFAIERRRKEVGIRKVNGAKELEIIIMLNSGFVKLVIIAFIVAVPVTYFFIQKWLEDFAYKTKISWDLFGITALLALGIALLTVSWQSWRAATKNPVEALRYE